MKLLFKLAVLYLLAVVFYTWGIMSYHFVVFPWPLIKPTANKVYKFLIFDEGAQNTLFDKIIFDHQERRSNYNFSGLQYRDNHFIDDGYLLISRYSKIHEQVIIELLSLEKNEILYVWIPPLDDIFERTPKFIEGSNTHMAYRAQHPLLLPDGDVVFTSGEGPLVRMTACGELKWVIPRHFHHSIELDSNGNLVVPIVVDPKKAKTAIPIRDDGFAVVSLDGKILKEYSVTDILLRNGMQGIVYGVGHFEYDRIHLNDAQPILSDNNEAQRGDIALSIRHLSTVALFRPSTGKLVWSKTGPWLNQHDINQLTDGKYSIFGNDIIRHKKKRNLIVEKQSEIYICNSVTGEISTPYSKVMGEYEIYSPTAGRSRILSNGDAFIEQSDTSRLLRISRNKIRWEYVNITAPRIVGALHWTRYIPASEANFSWGENLKCE